MRILKSHMASVQDAGRTGFRNKGIYGGGVMDRHSCALCNMLVANEPLDAVVEINGGEWESVSEQHKLIAVGGFGYEVFADERPINLWQPYFLSAGEKLRVVPSAGGGTACLAIHGGIRVKPLLGSRSTNLLAHFGGMDGRLLKKGDRLPTAILNNKLAEKIIAHLLQPAPYQKLRLANAAVPNFSTNIVRVFEAYEYDWFEDAAKWSFSEASFELTATSNRMGYRLKGIPLQLLHNKQLLSTAVLPGTIQVSSDGQLLILMADAQTTGGYPRIAQVIKADLPLLAQKTAGCQLQFQLISVAEAENINLKKEEELVLLRKDFELFFA
jgi:biotin-dependent carboxylase-like uncharacterized protein